MRLERMIPAPVAAKVPEVTVLFWVIKLVTTFMGEATSDYFAGISKAVAGGAETLILVAALWFQFRTTRYRAPAYWGLAMAIAIFGTGVSDALHLVIGVPYAGTSALWAVVLAAVVWQWDRSEHTLSIHSITNTRREIYYWATVFATFALGTALGDFSASALKIGFGGSVILYAVIILIPLASWRYAGMNAVLAFWFAYVDTRPVGASLADYLGKSHKLSGLALGSGTIAAISALLLVILVAYLDVTRRDIQPPVAGPAPTS